MANEISIGASLIVSKGGFSVKGTTNARITMSGDDMVQSTQVVGTTAEALTWGEITGAPKYVHLVNMDNTNFVTIGFTNPPTEMKLLAGESMLFAPTTATIYAKADTADVRVGKVACEA